MENLPMPTDRGWRWERVYRGQTLTVETYRRNGSDDRRTLDKRRLQPLRKAI